ncbi:hypothetical protein FAM09_03485 [Niastella caeni]|uniref:Uncharacterized protein n=1 Tax=Niastella caeni TaxID=2569763 RepID=A0A4S8I1U6_9BACT|nr:hypothetical protein [Niastella caeni]THU41189.1 hypothetical protein FAM09_03485 [Niastella caeni]
MEEKFVDIYLSVDIKKDLLLAHVQFFNNSDTEIFLDTKTICSDNRTRRSVFHITDENQNKVQYQGILVKRVVVPEDYVPLKAGEKIEATIVLNEVYKLEKGHKYNIQYSVFHPTYMDEAGFTKLESNQVEVNY